MKKLLIALLVLSPFVVAKEQTILTEDLRKGGLIVKGFIVDTQQPFCDKPTYDYNDRDSNGVFDRVCVGLKYDPCNKEESIALAYIKWQQDGKVCQDRPKCGELTVSPAPTPPIGCKP